MLDKLIFKEVKVSDLLEEIYKNQKEKKKQINGLILSLQPLINSPGDATLIVPLIKEYLDVGVKNDEHLIKLGLIVQKLVQNIGENKEYELSSEEMKQLQEQVEQMRKDNDLKK